MKTEGLAQKYVLAKPWATEKKYSSMKFRESVFI